VRIESGWRRNKRISGLGYDPAAHHFGVYIWEYINVLQPLLQAKERDAMSDPIQQAAQRVWEASKAFMESALADTAHKVLEDGVPRYVWEPYPLPTSLGSGSGLATITIDLRVEVTFERPEPHQALCYRLVEPETAQLLVDATKSVERDA